jgi:signal transduction histidine kinase
LRSPLHGILASAEFLADSALDDFQKSLVDTVDSCGRTLLDTIEHVLDFSKVNSLSRDNRRVRRGGPFDLNRKQSMIPKIASVFKSEFGSDDHFAATDLSVVTEEVLEGVFVGFEFRGMGNHSNVDDLAKGMGRASSRRSTIFQLPGKSTLTVIIDIDYRANWNFMTLGGAWRRVVMNIFGNALKYTSEGWIRVKLEAQDIPGEDKASIIVLTISDSGKGISSDFLKSNMFVPFSQENTLMPGTGLGMSIVKQIVDLLGGKIQIRSEVGMGTEVKVSLMAEKARSRYPSSPDNMPAIIDQIRARPQKLVALCGFQEDEADNPLSGTTTTLKISMASYLQNWLNARVVVTDDPVEIGEADIVLLNETAKVAEYLTSEDPSKTLIENTTSRESPGHRGGPPLIVLCSNAARYEIYAPQARMGGIMGFVSRPAGPHKVAKAIWSCLEQLDAVDQAGTAVSEFTSPQDLLISKSLISQDVASQENPMQETPSEFVDAQRALGIIEPRSDDITPIPFSPPDRPTTALNISKMETEGTQGDVGYPFLVDGTEALSLNEKLFEKAKESTSISFTARTPHLPHLTTSEPANDAYPSAISTSSNPSPRTSLSRDPSAFKIDPSSFVASPQLASPVSESPRSAVPTSLTQKLEKPTVLLVEDNSVNLMLLATYMRKKKSNYTFEKAENGLIALEKVQARPDGFDIVFMGTFLSSMYSSPVYSFIVLVSPSDQLRIQEAPKQILRR